MMLSTIYRISSKELSLSFYKDIYIFISPFLIAPFRPRGMGIPLRCPGRCQIHKSSLWNILYIFCEIFFLLYEALNVDSNSAMIEWKQFTADSCPEGMIITTFCIYLSSPSDLFVLVHPHGSVIWCVLVHGYLISQRITGNSHIQF